MLIDLRRRKSLVSCGGWQPSRKEREAQSAAVEVLDHCLILRLNRLSREVERECTRRLRPWRLTNAQLRLLAAIAVMEPVKLADLGRIFSVDKSSISRTVKRMFARGWLDVALPEDGRSAALVVTHEAWKVLTAVIAPWKRAQDAARCKVMTALSLQERAE
jgi:DNA-binding MarR family transcriptional regulator